MMFLRIAMMDAHTLQHIVDLLQEPRTYPGEKGDANSTQETDSPAALGTGDPPARPRTVRISEPDTLPASRSSTRQDVSIHLCSVYSFAFGDVMMVTRTGALFARRGTGSARSSLQSWKPTC
jgi:hypothetical protein